MKTLLILEGGGLRGIYTAGVLDAFMKNKIKVDTVIGVSVGALFGINYLSNQRGRVIRYNLDNIKNKNYMGISSLIRTGNIMNKDFCFDKLIYETDPFDFETFNKSKTDFYCVVTNVVTGKPEYIKIDDIENQLEYLRASGSMPVVSRIVHIRGKEYLDGGISDSVPIKWGLKNGYKKIIVVETRPKDYRKKKHNNFLFKRFYKNYPKFVETYSNRYKVYNKTKEYIESLEEEKRVFVIRPSELVKISRIEKNKDKIQEMYRLGMRDANNKLKDLKKYLK